MPTKSFVPFVDGPLANLHGHVFGQGPLGLFTAFALARNGASVALSADLPIEAGTGFVHAAGLFEPVATSDARAARYLKAGLGFCQWAASDDDWGIEDRPVLFLSDDARLTEQDWMTALPTYRPARPDELVGDRAYGAWFDSYVLQPDIAAKAIKRELGNLDIQATLESERIRSVGQAAALARRRHADFFVLALGLGLAALDDIAEVVEPAAGISAGVGVTIRLPSEEVRLKRVLMDADELGYLIPQRTMVIGGGTNILLPHDDPIVTGSDPSRSQLKDEWSRTVLERIERLRPGTSRIAGDVRMGIRPLRERVLTAFTGDFEIPGILIGGAGGSGWTFSVGIAEDACGFLAQRLRRTRAIPLVRPSDPESPRAEGAFG